MEHLAIDLGGKESQVCARTPAGEILVERRIQTAMLSKFLRGRPRSRVIVETCTEAFLIATCEVNGINPVAYLADVLLRVQTHPVSRIDELLPHRWKPREAKPSA